MLSPAARHPSSANPMNQLPDIYQNSLFHFASGINCTICEKRQILWVFVRFLPIFEHELHLTVQLSRVLYNRQHRVVWDVSAVLEKKKSCILKCFKADWVKKGQRRFLKEWSDCPREKHRDEMRTVLLKLPALKYHWGYWGKMKVEPELAAAHANI